MLIDPETALALQHYGVRGMRWGHRKAEDTSDNGRAKAYIAALNVQKPKRLSAKERKASLTENHEKFLAKFEPPPKGGGEKKSLSREQKIAIATGAAAAVAAAGYLAYRHYAGRGPKVSSILSFEEKLRGMAGKPISVDSFREARDLSTKGSWVEGNFLHPSSFARGEKIYPKGHVFHRLSIAAEDRFSHATYSVDGPADFGRYVNTMSESKNVRNWFHVSFTAHKEIRLPSTTTAVETMREVLSREGSVATRESAMKAYNEVSGSMWQSPRATQLMEALKGKGYHGLVDEMDAGVVGESPLVLFSHDRVSDKVSKSLSLDEIQKARSSLTEIANRKIPVGGA